MEAILARGRGMLPRELFASICKNYVRGHKVNNLVLTGKKWVLRVMQSGCS